MSGIRIMMTSAHFADLADLADREAGRLRLRARAARGRQADADADAAVLQVQRVRVPLRSVADNRNLLRP